MSPAGSDRGYILVAEDDPGARRIICHRLSRAGYEVAETADGAEALLLAQERVPELLITDWMMPGLDGVELCRRFKADPALQRVYTIMVTARDSLDDKVSSLDLGADDFLVKPISGEELAARVRVGIRIARLMHELEERKHDQAVVEMALAVGHAVNNPLTSLIGYLDMLLEPNYKVDPEQVEELLENCRTDALRIAGVVARLSALDKPKLVDAIPGVKMVNLD